MHQWNKDMYVQTVWCDLIFIPRIAGVSYVALTFIDLEHTIMAIGINILSSAHNIYSERCNYERIYELTLLKILFNVSDG